MVPIAYCRIFISNSVSHASIVTGGTGVCGIHLHLHLASCSGDTISMAGEELLYWDK